MSHVVISGSGQEPGGLRAWLEHKATLWAFSIMFVTLVLIGGFIFYVNEHQDNVSCERQSENREVIRNVIEIATEPGDTVDFTQIQGYENLDPETQVYFVAVGDAINATANNIVNQRDKLLAAIPPITC